MNHMHYFYILVIYDIEDHILPDRKAAHAATQIIAGATHARILVDQVETLDDPINDIVGGACVAAFFEDIIPNVAEVGTRLWCQPMRHLFV